VFFLAGVLQRVGCIRGEIVGVLCRARFCGVVDFRGVFGGGVVIAEGCLRGMGACARLWVMAMAGGDGWWSRVCGWRFAVSVNWSCDWLFYSWVGLVRGLGFGGWWVFGVTWMLLVACSGGVSFGVLPVVWGAR